MMAATETAHTAGKNAGQTASQNPVACDDGNILYNLNMGYYEFSIQTTDLKVSPFET